ncbi:hypothetical protein HNV11_02585 [Spirosoma taeanense]|uniref:Uncharacterized protein n=1 Tax=Spirosoma taeanense TaxID=2735870 RepID=A0A6M5Y0N8_9BACT|nr:hypothetical protein [Spirosoma taeanense]QJW88338.1 hypothetical protein HNV11_02585 [Spirosoma taeanense]
MDSIFNENVGRFLDPKETKLMTGAYRDRKLAAGLTDEDYVRSEYFGLNQIQYLLSQPGCVGLRVHHAKRWEDAEGRPTEEGKGQLKPRVLLTGVDADGRDIFLRMGSSGLKDMAGSDGMSQALGDGHTCPQHCGR